MADRRAYLMMYDEPSLGGTPSPLTYYHVPVEDYDVQFVPKRRVMAGFLGNKARRLARNYAGYPQGKLVTPLHGWIPSGLSVSLMQTFLTWAFGNLNTCEPPSKACEWYEYICNSNQSFMRHSGMRVNTAVLTGQSMDNGTGIVRLELGLIGQDEVNVGSAQALPTQLYGLAEAEYSDCTFTLDGSAIQLNTFVIQADFGLVPSFMNSTRPYTLRSMDQQLTAILVPLKPGNTYDAYTRSTSAWEPEFTFTIKAPHQGTGSGGTTFTVATGTCPRMSYFRDDETRDPNAIQFQPLIFDLLKPNTSSSELSFSYSEV